MSSYLAQVEASHPGEFILMVLDGAGWHKARDLEVPKRMRLAFLPPYSPELNPEEQVWDELREKSLANRVFATLDAALDAAREGLAAMASLPEALMRLAGRNWILDPL
jgi:transposase